MDELELKWRTASDGFSSGASFLEWLCARLAKAESIVSAARALCEAMEESHTDHRDILTPLRRLRVTLDAE